MMELPGSTRPTEALSHARLLLEWFDQLSTFNDAVTWDLLAQKEVSQLERFIGDGTQRLISTERKLALLNQIDRQLTGKVTAGTRLQHAEIEAMIEHIKKLRGELEEASQALQVRIDITPCDEQQQQQIIGELLDVRDLLEQRRRENQKGLNLARRQIESAQPDETQAFTETPEDKHIGADLRHSIHLAQASQVAIEQQIDVLDRWISMFRSFV